MSRYALARPGKYRDWEFVELDFEPAVGDVILWQWTAPFKEGTEHYRVKQRSWEHGMGNGSVSDFCVLHLELCGPDGELAEGAT